MARYIDADTLKRKAQKVATEAWKMKLTAKIETTLNQFIDWIDEMPTVTINDLVEKNKVTNCNHIADDSKKAASSCDHENGKDIIYRQDAIEAIDDIETEVADGFGFQYEKWRKYFVDLSSAQPEPNCSEMPNNSDTISRQTAIDALLDELMEKPEQYEDGLDRHDIEAVLGALPSAQHNTCENTCEIERKSNDLISRQDAIDTLNEYFARIGKLKRRGLTKGEKAISLDTVGAIKSLPSVQPETHEKRTETHGVCLNAIDRQAAIDALDDIESEVSRGLGFQYEKWRKHFTDMPSAKPEPEEFEWCTDCKEYDQTAHCCHRWTKVIRQTVDEIKAEQPERKRGKWIYHRPPDDWVMSLYTYDQCGHVEDGKPNFCPNCGCRMLKEGDTE
jgi:hypothetical protein